MKRGPEPQSYPIIHDVYRVGPSQPNSPGMGAEHNDFRLYYDPIGKFEASSIDTLVEHVAATRADVHLPGLGHITGHEVIAAETTHALIGGMDTVPLEIGKDRQQEVAEAASRQAGRIAVAALDVADDITKLHARTQAARPNYKIASLPPRLVLGGKVLAAVAHENVFRRSGRPYYQHPDEVSSIFSVAWRKQYGDRTGTDTNPNLRDIVRFLSYGHDAFEDTIDPKSSYLNRAVIVTPLVGKFILEAEEIPDATTVARTMLYMSRTEDTEGNRMPYPQYIDSGIQRGGEYFVLTKSPDVSHNSKIEPIKIVPGDEKSAAKARKRRMYEDAIIQLLKGSDRFDTSLVAHTVFSVTREEVQAEARDKFSFSIGAAAEQVRQKVAALS